MLAKVLRPFHRVLLFVTLAVALAATGLAHRMPSAEDGALAFALANGANASDFCGGLVDTGKRATAPHCPACQLSAGADLPRPVALPVNLALALQADLAIPDQTAGGPRPLDPAHAAQGPPIA
jgi:hypothetical protein